MTDPVSAFFPVTRQRLLHRPRIAAGNAFDNLGVLRYREMQILNDRVGIETPVTFDLRLDHLMQCSETRAGSRTHYLMMEVRIKFKDGTKLNFLTRCDLM